MKPGILIPKPCHENWGDMTPSEKGRHCGVCDKVVTDFTTMKQEQILQVISQTQGAVCGRVTNTQLTHSDTAPKNRWMKLMPWMASVIPLFAFFMKGKAQVELGEIKMGKVAYTSPEEQKQLQKIRFVVAESALFKGGKIAHVKIVVSNEEEVLGTVYSDRSGIASLQVPLKKVKYRILTLTFSAEGYLDKSITNLQVNKTDTTIQVFMEREEIMYMMGMMVAPDDIPLKDSVEQLVKDPEVPGDTTGVITPEVYHINVFPVPAATDITVEIPDVLLRNTEGKLFNAEGILVKQFMVISNAYTTSVQHLPPGNYTLVFSQHGKAIETKQILIAR